MTHKTLFDLLKTLNIPVAYDHFEDNKNISPPFIAYREVKRDSFFADGINYYNSNNFEIELVTEKKDIMLQQSIEELLTTNKIPYEVDDEIWDKEEKIYHNFYEI